MTKSPSSQLDADLLTLRALIAVVEDGSFSSAAKRIGRSQSAISLKIGNLEDRMAVRLLEKTGRSVELTLAGETFLPYARRIIELADEGLAAVTTPDVTEPMRIGFAEYLVPQHLHQLLSRFKKGHPKAKIELHLGLGFVLYQDLMQHQLDIVVAGPEGKDGQILLNEPLVWVGPKGRLPENDEKTLPLILMPPPCSYRQAAFNALTETGLPWLVSMNANSIQAAQSAVAAGLGVSVMAKSAVTSHMEIIENRLPKLPETSINAYWNKTDPHPLTPHFVKFLKEELILIKNE